MEAAILTETHGFASKKTTIFVALTVFEIM
jgi:hypothetical protein